MNPSMKLSDNKFRRNWKKIDENKFTKEFESTKWDRVLNLEEKDTDESFIHFSISLIIFLLNIFH